MAPGRSRSAASCARARTWSRSASATSTCASGSTPAHAHTELADAYLRHGLHRAVVSLEQPAAVRVTLASIDQRNWRGAAAVRILRWPQPAPDAPPDQRLLGFHGARQGQRAAGAKRSRLVARGDRAHARGRGAFRGGERHAGAGRKPNTSAAPSSSTCCTSSPMAAGPPNRRRRISPRSDDSTGEARAAVLRALNEFNLAAGMGPEVPRAEQRALLDTAVASRCSARRSSSKRTNCTPTRSPRCLRAAFANDVLGDFERAAPVYRDSSRARARARGDKLFEVRATQNLAFIARRQGNMAQAVAMCDELLPLIERDRNPDLYATLVEQSRFRAHRARRFRPRADAAHRGAGAVFRARRRGPDGARARGAGGDPVPQRQRRARAGHHRKRAAAVRTCARPGRLRFGACASRAMRRPSSVSTTLRSNTCAAPSDRDKQRHHHRADARAHRRRIARARQPARRRTAVVAGAADEE